MSCQAQRKPWEQLPALPNQHWGVHTFRLTLDPIQGPGSPRRPGSGLGRALGRGQEAGCAMNVLVPPGAGCAGLGRDRYQQGLGEEGSCPTKPLLNKKPQRRCRAGPGARLASQRAQLSCCPASTESRDFSHHILNSEKPLGYRTISDIPWLRDRKGSYHLDKWHPLHRAAQARISMSSLILISLPPPLPPDSIIITNHIGCDPSAPHALAHFIIVTSL